MTDQINNALLHNKLHLLFWDPKLYHLPPQCLLEVKETSNQVCLREMICNLSKECSLEVNTNVCRCNLVNSRTEPVKGLSIALIGLACHEYPCHRYKNAEACTKHHDNEALIEGMGYNIECGINKHMDLSSKLI